MGETWGETPILMDEATGTLYWNDQSSIKLLDWEVHLFDQQLEHWYSVGQMTNRKMGIMSLRECNPIHEKGSMAEATDVYVDHFSSTLATWMHAEFSSLWSQSGGFRLHAAN